MILLLNCAHKISYALRLNIEAVIGKEPGSDLLADLAETPREAADNWSSPCRQTLAATIWGILSYHEDTGAAKRHIGIFSLAH